MYYKHKNMKIGRPSHISLLGCKTIINSAYCMTLRYRQFKKDVIQWNLPKAEVDYSPRDLHNSSRYAKVVFNLKPASCTVFSNMNLFFRDAFRTNIFFFADTSSNIFFWVFLNFFRLILVRNSVILSSDYRGQHFVLFYSCMIIYAAGAFQSSAQLKRLLLGKDTVNNIP